MVMDDVVWWTLIGKHDDYGNEMRGEDSTMLRGAINWICA